MKLLTIGLTCCLLMGCAFGAGQLKRTSTVEGCNDVMVAVRRVASGSMMPPEGAKTTYDEKLGLMINGVPVDFAAGQESNGYFGASNMLIKNCTQVSFIYEDVLADTIGVDIPGSLEKLWSPSTEPDLFGDRYWGPTEGEEAE